MYLMGRVNPIPKRHGKVQNGHIGAGLAYQAQRLAAIARFAYDLPTLGLEQGPNALAKHDVIVCQQYASCLAFRAIIIHDISPLPMFWLDGRRPGTCYAADTLYRHGGRARAVALYFIQVSMPVVRYGLTQTLLREGGTHPSPPRLRTDRHTAPAPGASELREGSSDPARFRRDSGTVKSTTPARSHNITTAGKSAKAIIAPQDPQHRHQLAYFIGMETFKRIRQLPESLFRACQSFAPDSVISPKTRRGHIVWPSRLGFIYRARASDREFRRRKRRGGRCGGCSPTGNSGRWDQCYPLVTCRRCCARRWP